MTVLRRIHQFIIEAPDNSELEIARALFGPGAVQQMVNGHIRRLIVLGAIHRDTLSSPYRYRAVKEFEFPAENDRRSDLRSPVDALSEDEIKLVLRDWLLEQGYEVQVAMGRERGIDIYARRGDERWIIEVKGPGSLQPMRVNYFVSMLGELLQRMDDPNARYSIALPDLAQFRRLWERLPGLAKQRTTIQAIFVSVDRRVDLGDGARA